MTVMMSARPGLRQLLTFICIVSLALAVMIAGCASIRSVSETGTRVDEKLIDQIVVGKTTRFQVYDLFGPPHSTIRGQAQFMEVYGNATTSDSVASSRIINSIDNMHEVILYRFGNTKSKRKETAGYHRSHIKGDTRMLLIMIALKSDVVVEMAYVGNK
jgi:hypothetical protein